MATIYLSNATGNAATLCLKNLDGNYAGGTRTCRWYISTNDYPSENSYQQMQTAYIYGTPDDNIGGSVTFTGLTPNTLYYCRCYVYTTQGTDNATTLLTTLSNTFQTIQETSEPWGVFISSIDVVEGLTEKYVYLTEKRICGFSVTFQNSGTAYFETTGPIDTYGYLSRSPNCDETNGVPISPIASDDDSGSDVNFSIEFDVVAGETYYIWVRGYDGDETGSLYLCVTAPESSSPTWNVRFSTIENIFGDISMDITRYPYISHCYAITFSKKGKVHIYDAGELDVYCFMTSTTSYNPDTGRPLSPWLADSDIDYPYQLSYDVESGVTYYLWVYVTYPEVTGTINLNIKFRSRPDNFSWTHLKEKGKPFNLTATEWNDFTSCVDSFYAYMGFEKYNFTEVIRGAPFTYYIYLVARAKIRDMREALEEITNIPVVKSGDDITAYMMNVLVDDLNSIP